MGPRLVTASDSSIRYFGPDVALGLGETTKIVHNVRMNTPSEEHERPNLSDLPRLFRSTVDRGIDLASARVELIQAEIREEAERRLRRLPNIIIPATFLLLGFALLNVGLVAWLAGSIGLTAAAFSLAGLYVLIGGIGTWWFLRSGGLNPPDAP